MAIQRMIFSWFTPPDMNLKTCARCKAEIDPAEAYQAMATSFWQTAILAPLCGTCFEGCHPASVRKLKRLGAKHWRRDVPILSAVGRSVRRCFARRRGPRKPPALFEKVKSGKLRFAEMAAGTDKEGT
jgi:hypothetical protein